MASIVDSIRSVYQDNYALLKLGIFSCLIFLILGVNLTTKSFNFLNFIIWLVVYYIYLGFACIIISNRINQRIQTLPPFDPLLFNAVSLKAFAISIPYLLIGYFVVNIVVGMFNFEGVPQLVAIWLIRFFIFSVLMTALINYSEKYDIRDGLNLSKIAAGVADVLVFTLVGVILVALYSLFIVLPTLYLIYRFFEFGPLFKYTAVLFSTLNIAFLSDYWGQLHYDIESKNNYY